MNIVERPVKDSDMEFLWTLQKETMQYYVEAIWGWNEDDQRKRFLDKFKTDNRKILECDGKSIGLWHIETHPDHIFLASILIQPSYQNRGVGTAKISELIKEADKCKIPIRLQVLLGNPAVNFYKRLGFSEYTRSDTHRHLIWDFTT